MPWMLAAALLAGAGLWKYAPIHTGVVNNVHPPAQQEDVLTVITTRSYHTYFNSEKNTADGLAFQLVNRFAREQQMQVNIVLAAHSDDIYQALENGIADIGLVGKPLSLSRQNSYPQTQPYMNVTTQLVYRHGSGTPQTFESLAGKTIMVADNEQNREKYAFIQDHYPEVEWQFSDFSTEELLGMVNTGAIDHTLINSHEYLKLRSLYTRTRVAFDIYYPEPVTLALSQSAQQHLNQDLHRFFDRMKANGTLEQLIERYYGHVSDSNPRGSMTFFRRVSTRLPHYQDLIEQVAQEYRMDWRLLAAIAYQESHWNPRARSHTGVRGMMMLTQPTAREMGVSNRLDSRQSLEGGARYLKKILARLPESIKQPDRTWFALAAYNVGLGHVFDARDITEFHGDNPDRWSSVKNYLPLLEQEEWHKYTRYGHARGSEPVKYVQNIRHFNDLLAWRFPAQNIAPESRTRVAVKKLDTVIKEARRRKTDPTQGPVKLSSLMPEERPVTTK